MDEGGDEERQEDEYEAVNLVDTSKMSSLVMI